MEKFLWINRMKNLVKKLGLYNFGIPSGFLRYPEPEISCFHAMDNNLLDSAFLTESEKSYITETRKQKENMNDALASMTLHRLSQYL